jgi:hypothetical protein
LPGTRCTAIDKDFSNFDTLPWKYYRKDSSFAVTFFLLLRYSGWALLSSPSDSSNVLCAPPLLPFTVERRKRRI